MDESPLARRKNEHLSLALEGNAGFCKTTTLLEEVTLVHEALPELSLDQIDTSVSVLGRSLRFPLIIAGMTGGSARARDINRRLASLAQERGYGFGLGSQRPMIEDPEVDSTYQVRDLAPDILLLGNLGVVQARNIPSASLQELIERVGADALCLHLNPAQELVQPEGDHNFQGAIATFERVVRDLSVPVVAKETGCGLSFSTAKRLRSVGVEHVDVSGAGGTSWVAIEAQRAQGQQRALGEILREWGIPTAASVLLARQASLQTILATGGIRTGLEAAKALALGATAVGMARPVLQALEAEGRPGAISLFESIEMQLRAVMLLVGACNLGQLRACSKVLGPALESWAKSER